jgi:hypothetical protein
MALVVAIYLISFILNLFYARVLRTWFVELICVTHYHLRLYHSTTLCKLYHNFLLHIFLLALFDSDWSQVRV